MNFCRPETSGKNAKNFMAVLIYCGPTKFKLNLSEYNQILRPH